MLNSGWIKKECGVKWKQLPFKNMASGERSSVIHLLWAQYHSRGGFNPNNKKSVLKSFIRGWTKLTEEQRSDTRNRQTLCGCCLLLHMLLNFAVDVGPISTDFWGSLEVLRKLHFGQTFVYWSSYVLLEKVKTKCNISCFTTVCTVKINTNIREYSFIVHTKYVLEKMLQ